MQAVTPGVFAPEYGWINARIAHSSHGPSRPKLYRHVRAVRRTGVANSHMARVSNAGSARPLRMLAVRSVTTLKAGRRLGSHRWAGPPSFTDGDLLPQSQAMQLGPDAVRGGVAKTVQLVAGCHSRLDGTVAGYPELAERLHRPGGRLRGRFGPPTQDRSGSGFGIDAIGLPVQPPVLAVGP